jgi:hypothetical protein
MPTSRSPFVAALADAGETARRGVRRARQEVASATKETEAQTDPRFAVAPTPPPSPAKNLATPLPRTAFSPVARRELTGSSPQPQGSRRMNGGKR